MAMSTFQSFKHEIVTAAALSKDALHIYVGLGVFLITSMFAKKGMRSVVPLIAVLMVAVAGEILDVRDELHRAGRWKFWASVHDFVNTAFWPLLLWMLARYTRVMK